MNHRHSKTIEKPKKEKNQTKFESKDNALSAFVSLLAWLRSKNLPPFFVWSPILSFKPISFVSLNHSLTYKIDKPEEDSA